MMTLDTLEGLLARITLSEYRDDLVVKGGGTARLIVGIDVSFGDPIWPSASARVVR